jgi:hypothetical protein
VTYKTILEFQAALQSGEIDKAEITAYECKRELFIRGKNGEDLFSAYYGTHNACYDICMLLDLGEPEEV